MNDIDISKLDLNLLKSFQALFTERQVSRAAEKMHISQSAMSHNLSRLRKAFDDELFMRTAKGMEPNARCLELGERVMEILGQVGTLFEEQQFDPKAIKTRFRIQTHGYISIAYFPKILRELRLLSPGLTFEIQNITRSCYDLLDDDQVDMIVGSGLGAGQHHRQAPFTNDDLCCLLDANHPALKDWSAENIFGYPHVKLTLLDDKIDPVTRFAKTVGENKRDIGLYTDTLHIQAAFLTDTELIAFVPRRLASLAAKSFDLKIAECPFELPTLHVKSIWHPRSENDPTHYWIRSQFHTLSNSLALST